MTATPAPATPELDAASRDALAELLLTVADDEFVIGFWDSEWTGIAPMLEEDVAMSSLAQDEIGHAKVLYELLGELTGHDADRIAFGRQSDEYRHAALMNHARTNWAFTIARRFLYDTADAVRLEALVRSGYPPLAQLAVKMRREESYHLMHMRAWLRRLAAAPASRRRLNDALVGLWDDARTVFTPLEHEQHLLASGILPEPLSALHDRWLDAIGPTLTEHDLSVPEASQLASPPAADGRRRRTDDFTWLWNEFTLVHRSEEEGTPW